MKFARIVGRVTLSVVDPGLRGGRLLIGIPCRPDTAAPVRGQALPKGNSLVVYDILGAGQGDMVAYTDGGEAAAPFKDDVACDAYCSALIDQVFWEPLKN